MWGGRVTTQLESVIEGQAEAKTEIEEYKQDIAQENLRQWARMNQNEKLIQQVISTERATSAIVSRMEEDLRGLRRDLTITNDLLREFLIESARRDKENGTNTR